MKVKIKKLHPSATIPKHATSGAACFDLHALIDGEAYVYCYVNAPKTFRTGLSFEIPEGHVMLVYSRSGHGFTHGVRLANCVGIIDADYRGELLVKLTPDEENTLMVVNGDRIAQAMIVPVDRVDFEEVEELNSTDRGAGGFGSTGQ